MKALNPYLLFDGNAREAMEFYQDCFGGKLEMMDYESSPEIEIADKHKKLIMHSSLRCEHTTILASDNMPGKKLKKGDNIQISIDCISESELTQFFFSLSEEGEILFPLQDTFWGAKFGQVRDKFGVHWMLSFERE